MRVIGIDPGLTRVGIGIVERSQSGALITIDWMTIETAGEDRSLRLQEIQRDFQSILSDTSPDLAVVERVFFARNARTAIDVAQARGVLLSILAEHGIPVIEPSPPQIKAAIAGDGKADKRQMRDMVVRILNLPEPPTPADAADALAMACYGIFVQPAFSPAFPGASR
jgi:crossover junction endodeoxyribonuclease RuvC